MTRPTCLVPGCLRRDVGTTELERIPLCGGHLRLWDSTPHGTDAEKWASYIALSEGVRTPLPPRELVRVGSQEVTGGFVARYVDAHHAHDVAPGATNGAEGWGSEGSGPVARPGPAQANAPTSSEGSPSHANGVGHG